MQDSKTMSVCTYGRDQGAHVFHIFGYSHYKNTAAGNKRKTLISTMFPVGRHGWGVFFRAGDDMVTAGVLLANRHGKVRASCELRLVDQITGVSVSVHKESPREFQFRDEDPRSFMSAVMQKRSVFESPTYLRDDCLTIECTVTVINETETKSLAPIQVPEPDIGGHYAKLLEEKVGVDVTLSVQGEEFMAHKVVLAARSPVFKAQLYGPMREAAGAVPIVIRDMQPAVFRLLLNFIYADSLPPLDYLEADARTDMIRHLLVAADRYGMERLSLMCQGILCEGLRVQTVATTFALADQHHCDMLKDACLEFITCSTAMAAVKKTPGYKNLKRTCPPDVIEAFEKASRSRKS